MAAVEIHAFRDAAREWLTANATMVPHDWGPIVPSELVETARRWQRAIHDGGFAGIAWPTEYGGRGLSPDHDAVWLEEAANAGVPPVLNMVGLVLAANALLAYGSDEQRRRFLPATARGDIVWCQLFSEPGAGSDLASLATTATRDGDEYVVQGQKVWTSNARVADWGILLARTRPLSEAPKHKGISFFTLEMSSPGIEVRPLRQMNGDSEFDEVFLDNVRVPARKLVGPEHEGWKVAMATLTNERGFIGASAAAVRRRVDELIAEVGAGNAVARDRVGRLVVTGRALEALGRRQGPVATSASSLVKLGLAEIAIEMAAARAAGEGVSATVDGATSRAVVTAPGARLGGGTSEIQRTIIGERLLGLPPEPRPNP